MPLPAERSTIGWACLLAAVSTVGRLGGWRGLVAPEWPLAGELGSDISLGMPRVDLARVMVGAGRLSARAAAVATLAMAPVTPPAGCAAWPWPLPEAGPLGKNGLVAGSCRGVAAGDLLTWA